MTEMYSLMQTATAVSMHTSLSVSLGNLTILELTEIHLPLPSECRIKCVPPHLGPTFSFIYILIKQYVWLGILYIFTLQKWDLSTLPPPFWLLCFFRVSCSPGYMVLICCVAENDCSSAPRVYTSSVRGITNRTIVLNIPLFALLSFMISVNETDFF